MVLSKLSKFDLLTVDEIALEASICRDSFYDFVQTFWDVIIPEKAVWNWHIKAICDELQTAAERIIRGEPKLYDIVINVPPGTSKSTIASVMLPAWIWTRMPTVRTINASYSYNLAMDLSRKSRDIIESDRWKKLFGDTIELREDQNTKGYFINNHGGSRFCVGTNGTVTGFHGHLIIVDDPLDPNRAVSETELKTANRWVNETLKTRKIDKEVTLTILIMQRLHQNDPAAVMLGKGQDGGGKIRHINLPALIEGKGLDVVRPRKLAKHYKEGLLDRKRLSRKVLEEARIELGEYAFSGQFLQRPTPLGGGMFKIDRLRLGESPPRDRDFVKRIRFWDKAGTQDGGAYTAGVLMGLDNQKRFWVLDVVRGQWESNAREKVIKQTAQLDTRVVEVGVEQEPGSGGKESAFATVKNLAGFVCRVEKPTGEKALRADPFSVQVNGENVYLKAGHWNRLYIEELQFFPFSTYKDQVDASSGAFTLLTRPRVRVGGLPRS